MAPQDDEDQQIEQLVTALRPGMESARFKYDVNEIRDVIRIVRAVGVAEGNRPRLDVTRLDG